MVTKRLPANDPRTIARDIPGLFDALFPQLVPGFVANLNRQSIQVPECEAVSSDLVSASSLQKAMLFEVAVAAAEKLITDHGAVEWDACLSIALQRQRKHFDAKRCRRDLCWNLIGAVSGWIRILDQAARSIGVSTSFWVSVCQPSTFRMVI
jgi:hypothetical protein